jgi:hypothetical protein
MMADNKERITGWIRLGIISGLLSSIIYPALIFIPLPSFLQVTLVMAWGPLLGLSAAGLYYFISLNKKTVSLQIALISQVIAGILVTLMLNVQMALRSSKPDNIDAEIWNSINHIQLGIDVTWDLFIFLSTFLFALNMFNHPKLGKLLSVPGIVISVLLIAFNILSFPAPPAEAELIDMGPLVGLWGLAVTITILVNFKWIEQKLAEQ